LKKACMLVAAILIGLVVAVTGSAQVESDEKACQAQEKVPASGKRIKTTEPVKRLMGELISIDMSAKTVTVKGRKGETLFDISGARIARAVKLEDLKPGDRIAVVYIEKDNKKFAKVVGKPMGRSKRAKGADETRAPEKGAPVPEVKQ
jgi:hypothetical protein